MFGIYERQKDLADYTAKTALVIGVGGVGSWIALFSALLGVEYLIIFDTDTLEEHNLNRTPFTTAQVGKLKTDAIAELISERRPFCTIEKHNEKFDLALIKDKTIDYVFDCTDNTQTQALFQADVELMKNYIKLGYDGWSMTWDRSLKPAWGEDSSYTVTPSILIPPVFLSIQAILSLVQNDGYGKCRTFDALQFSKEFYK